MSGYSIGFQYSTTLGLHGRVQRSRAASKLSAIRSNEEEVRISTRFLPLFLLWIIISREWDRSLRILLAKCLPNENSCCSHIFHFSGVLPVL